MKELVTGAKRIAYVLTEGGGPTVMFCGGFKSDMTGSKATALEAMCQSRGQRFIRFDYTGHGQSSGEFKEGTISSWKNDALAVIDRLAEDSSLVIGSNVPYVIDRTEDYAVPVHGEDRGYPAILVEIRQDLIGSEAGIAEWAERLASALATSA